MEKIEKIEKKRLNTTEHDWTRLNTIEHSQYTQAGPSSVKSYKGLESSCILMYEYNGIEVKTNSSSIKLRYMDEHVHSHICQGERRRKGG